MGRQSHAALAEIRDSLLETYASNDAMNQLILFHLDPRAWRAQPPGQKGSGRTIAAIFAYLHNNRTRPPSSWPALVVSFYARAGKATPGILSSG